MATEPPIGLTILGATGTIGVNTLDVVARNPGRFSLVAITGHRNLDRLLEQCQAHRPRYAVLLDADAAETLQGRLADKGLQTEVLVGPEALVRVASLPEVDYVMAGIVGAAGLLPTVAAAAHGKRVLLANKEALVMSGRLFMDEARRSGAELLPIDSEHNAVFQCMPPGFERGLPAAGVERILLTASGGPFRDLPLSELDGVTPDQACAHPNWVMGRKISVDSATMMNKGLEVIEACWLFNASPKSVQVVMHPQSIVHSLVAYTDGSMLAQLGNPDMRTPIAHAMAWPERMGSGVDRLDLCALAPLEFRGVEAARFPCLGLAYQALERGGTASTVLNAANEVAVEAFLEGRVRFTDIPRIIEHVLGLASIEEMKSIETVLAADRQARDLAGAYLNAHAESLLSS
jgi:1-deoxy-D-xylulose-5-phosphate reductoisomerase